MKVEEYIGKGVTALEKGEEQKAYIAVVGDQFKEIKEEGLKPRENGQTLTQMFFDKKLAEKEAKRVQDTTKLYHVWVIAEVSIKSEDEVGDKWSDGYLPEKTIPPERIKFLKSNMPKYFEKNWKPAKKLEELENHALNKPRYGSGQRWKNIIVAKDEEEWEYFNNRRRPEHRTKVRGRRRGPQTKETYNNFPEAVQLSLEKGPQILLFKPGTTEEDVKKFLAAQWLNNHYIMFEIPYSVRNDEKIMRNMGYELYFNKKVLSPLDKVMITQSFEEGNWGIKAVREIMTRLGFEVEGAED